MRKILVLLSIIFSIFIYSCIKDDYDPDKCDSRIFLRFDWSDGDEPDDGEMIEVIITSTNEDTTIVWTDHNGEEIFIRAQLYEFVGFEPTTNVEVICHTATVNKDANGNYLEPDFFTGGEITQAIIVSDDDQVITIPMHQQVRTLIIRVNLKGDGLNILDRVDGVITGIAMSRHINNGFHPVDGLDRHPAFITDSVYYNLENQGNNVFSDSHRLLGLDGDVQQKLLFTAYYTDGGQKTFELDVTEYMLGFHTVDYHNPWILELTIQLGLNNMEVTIENWSGNYMVELPLQ